MWFGVQVASKNWGFQCTAPRHPQTSFHLFVKAHPCAIQGHSPTGPSSVAMWSGNTEVFLALKHCIILAAAMVPGQGHHHLLLPILLQTSRIFSPSHHLQGVWSGFWGRKRIGRSVRVKPVIPVGNQEIANMEVSVRDTWSLHLASTWGRGGSRKTRECFDSVG